MLFLCKLEDHHILLFGDFNEILRLGEKFGGRSKELCKIEEFQNCVDVCNLKDLSFSGSEFTWSNGKEGDQVVLERLDRFLADGAWDNIFPESIVYHLVWLALDHLPILMDSSN
ncbi:hypothetical protein M5689_003465 [Euphorbia peplus]|nr:hypothetical protein M5689_003465 [Euphorbia peplus]